MRDDSGLEVEFVSVDDQKPDEEHRVLSWDEFTTLMDSIEDGTRGIQRPSFAQNVFVGGRHGPAAIGQQYDVTHATTLGAISSGPDKPKDYLHLYYRVPEEDESGEDPGPEAGRLAFRPVGSSSDGSFPDGIGNVAPHFFNIEFCDHELQMMLVENPEPSRYPADGKKIDTDRGFSKDFREALFVDRDRERVVSMLD